MSEQEIGAADMAKLARIVRDHYPDDAEAFVRRQIAAHDLDDPEKALIWRRILSHWRWAKDAGPHRD